MSAREKSLDLLWDQFRKNEEVEDFEAEGVTPQSSCSMAPSRPGSSPSLCPAACSTPLNRDLARDEIDKRHLELIAAAEKLAQELKMKKKPSPHSTKSFEIEEVDAQTQTEKSYINIKHREKCKHSKRKHSSDSPTALITLFDEFDKPCKVIRANVNRNYL